MAESTSSQLKSSAGLLALLEDNIRNISTCVSLSDYTETLAPLKLHPESIEELHQIIQTKIMKNTREHVRKTLLKESAVTEMFQQLNDLSSIGVRVDGTAWRPSGDVKAHLRSLDADIYNQENILLEELILQKDKENELLMEQIRDLRKKLVESKMKQLNAIKRCEKEIHTSQERNVEFNTKAKELMNIMLSKTNTRSQQQ